MCTHLHLNKRQGWGGWDPSCINHFVFLYGIISTICISDYQPNKIYLKAQSIHLSGLLPAPTGQQGWSKKGRDAEQCRYEQGIITWGLANDYKRASKGTGQQEMHSTSFMWKRFCNLQNSIQIQLRCWILRYLKMTLRKHSATINKASTWSLNFHFEDKVLQEKQTESSPLDFLHDTAM